MVRIIGNDGDGPVAFNPLVWAYWVDPDTTVPALERTGSIAAPFATVQDAFDTFLSLGFGQATIFLCPSVNPGGVAGLVIPGDNLVGFNLAIVGQSGSARSTEDSLASQGYANGSWMGAITIDPGSHNIGLSLQNITFSGNIEALSEDEDPSDGSIGLVGCLVPAINAVAMRILLQECSAGDVRGGRIEGYASTTFGLQVNLWEATLIVLDESTNAAIVENGSSTSTAPRIYGRCQRATISVAVPALAAGELGYVDVDTTGVIVVLVGDVVNAVPTADLAAAGADGGFVGVARVSAANTVRVPFVGELTGGAVDFLIARV